MKYSVNELLAMERALRARVSVLQGLQNGSTYRTTYGDDKMTQEPTYDIKALDKKITKIQKALFEIDAKIKASNAVTEIEVAWQYDDLVEGL